MSQHTALEYLWRAAPPARGRFDPAALVHLPAPVQRYLTHAIAPGAPMAHAVRLQMHGEIKLGGWHRFSAEEVIVWGRGLIWNSSIRWHGLALRGGDRFLDGAGGMRWALFGLIPLVRASNPDISKSAAGRVNIESLWLPPVLCDPGVRWEACGSDHIQASFVVHGEAAVISHELTAAGGLRSVSMPRWGNPAPGPFRYEKCGAWIDAERTFGAYTIPSRVRVGWFFGSERFENGGEFFRATLDAAELR